MKTFLWLLLVPLWLVSLSAQTSTPAAEAPAHNELRALRAQVIEAITQGDFEGVARHVHPNVVVTWQNAEVCRGIDGLRAFFERMGKDAFQGYKVPPTPDELTILHGDDTGVSFGHVVATYRLLGREFEFTSRWTATLVRENGQWLLASYHVSLNGLDNPILGAAKRGLLWAAGIAALGGLVIGRLFGKRRSA